jgi:hypothetical protein
MGVGRAGQHADIGAGGEDPRLAGAQHGDADLRMLETQPLERVGELDIDAEIVGIEFQLIAFEQRALLVHVHDERGDLAVDAELPMAIARRLGLEIDPRRAIRQSLAVRQSAPGAVVEFSHSAMPRCALPATSAAANAGARRHVVNYNALICALIKR